ncbi:hypothetical protein E2R60_22945 [Paenibacillus dendritiformis]|uniref:hypothetical protein n=1 Tax=Paenibacillus dendritiformis TaxID=130049 RepID=UPI0010594886|nr:hypothetical protein [Paenibacillus dendritiformis]TDL50388.1 hypothetical protein E2R60_22945 [Paenibacillus dendritiformis]
MKKLLEIFFNEQFIFPYMHLEDAREQHSHYRNSNIYMVMLAKKYQILDAQCINQQLIVNYKCLELNESFRISNIILLPFDIPEDSIDINISDYGTAIEIGITNSGIKFIKKNHVDFFNRSNISRKKKISIYDLISISNQNKETSEEYEILYIGQSLDTGEGRNIFDRLSSHEKILKIYRDYNMKYRDKELVIFLLHAKSKLHTVMTPDSMTTISFGNSYWQTTDELGEKITDATVVNVIEAMLIYHFKPKYNIKLKNSIPNLDLKTYSELKNAGVHQIDVGLNLYFEQSKKGIHLLTDIISVYSKLRILHCYLENLYDKKDASEIEVEDIDDDLYRLINL